MRLLPFAMLLAAGLPLEAQSIDDGVFSIRRSGREIGREELSIRQGRHGSSTGSTIVSKVRIPAANPVFSQDFVIERRGDGGFANALINYTRRNGSGRVIAEVNRNILRIHTASGGSEAIREIPTPDNLLILADSAFTPFGMVSELATRSGTRIEGVYPLTGKRVTFTARREGDAQDSTRIVMAGEITGTIWLDTSGHLERIEFPGTQLEIVRLHQ